MKWVTYSSGGRVSIGALWQDDVVDLPRALTKAGPQGGGASMESYAPGNLRGDMLAFLLLGPAGRGAAQQALSFVERNYERARTEGWCLPATKIELRAPVSRPGKIVCVGLNYRSHLEEIGEKPSEYPILFQKPGTSVIGSGQAIRLPRISQQVDFEGELAVVIGRRGKSIPEKEALGFVAGYMCANDVSAHDIEFRTSQWESGKMLDTFCPLGPAIVTADEVPDLSQLRLTTFVNQQKVQEASVSEMVFPVPFLISYISSLATLEPGDVILTGTPAGIGCNRKPMTFLKPGDRVSVEIEGIGALTNPVVADEED